jgi:hypothetical protein
MKFKILFVIFNIVLFLSFLTIFLLPFFVLDASFLAEFWKKNWYFGLIFIAILALVNGVFFANWKTLSLLENEDWPALSRHLEREILERNRVSRRNVQLLADSLVLLGDFTTMRRLQSALAEKKPPLLDALAERFASGLLLSADYRELYAFSSAYRNARNRDWMRFFAAFARHMEKKFDESADEMLSLCETARDPLITALSGYFCGVLLLRQLPERSETLEKAGTLAKERVTADYTREKWNRLIGEEKSGIHVVVLTKLVDELDLWLFA